MIRLCMLTADSTGLAYLLYCHFCITEAQVTCCHTETQAF
uniref:Uncharacterized protein n=1 Tax=Anguilla anguilla TaxID=7936 RepID=A0A0E9QTU3_ANGAN